VVHCFLCSSQRYLSCFVLARRQRLAAERAIDLILARSVLARSVLARDEPLLSRAVRLRIRELPPIRLLYGDGPVAPPPVALATAVTSHIICSHIAPSRSRNPHPLANSIILPVQGGAASIGHHPLHYPHNYIQRPPADVFEGFPCEGGQASEASDSLDVHPLRVRSRLVEP
jgi:hypothetical protein